MGPYTPARFGEGDVPAVADHGVIEETDTEQLAGLFESARDRHVFGRWRGVSTGVPMHHDQRRGIREDRRLINLPRVGRDAVKVPTETTWKPCMRFAVEEERGKLLGRRPRSRRGTPR
jgi:hypothetical protein